MMLKNIRQSNLQTAIQYTHQNIVVERHTFSELARRNALCNSASLAAFQQETGLTDLFWQTLYYQSERKQNLNQAILEADGYVFFMHGWTGSHRIWEDLPINLAGKHKNIVCFNFDLNGFGQSPFINTTPQAEQCSPPALMNAVEYWLGATGLWPAFTQRKQRPFYLFAGHSMSGAALFYKNIAGWHNDAYTFFALAPALFCKDTQRQTFFKTIGISIRFPSFTSVKDALAPHVIDLFGNGASPQVKSEHLRIYNETPFGTLAQTIYALGATPPPPNRNDPHRFRIWLGRKDIIIRPENMLPLLKSLNVSPAQIKVAPGDHYFFSYGKGSPASHRENQQKLLQELLSSCFQLTEEARKSS